MPCPDVEREPDSCLAMWMDRAKHCPLCAADLRSAVVAGHERPKCVGCGWVLYKNPASAAAGVVLDERRRVLLIRRGIEPFCGKWALPAGYQDIDESPQQAVRREVAEETGILVEPYRLIDLIFIPDDPRKPANLAVYLSRVVGGELKAGDDASEAQWFDLRQLPEDIGFGNRERILLPLLEDPGRFGLDPLAE